MKRVFVLVVLLSVLAIGFSAPVEARGGGHGGGGHGGGGGGHFGGASHYGGSSGVSHYSSGGASHYGGSSHYGYSGGYGGRAYGGYGGGYSRYSYRGYAPRGAVFGAFLGGIVIGGVFSPFWWPYYAVPVPPAYYDPYYQYPYPAPPYVIEVPPAEATTAYQQGPPAGTTPPNQCYAPKTDPSGNVIKDNNGNMIPDFSKAVPCPPQQ